MDIQFSTLKQFEVQFPNGERGTIEDAFIDERRWRITRLIVRCGGWLFGARVAVNSSAVVLYQNGTQILKILKVEADTEPLRIDPADLLPRETTPRKNHEKGTRSATLHSLREMQGFQVQVSRRWSGFIKDLVVDPATWKIRTIVASRGVLFPGQRKEISLDDAKKVTWFERGLLVQPSSHVPQGKESTPLYGRRR